MIKGCWGSETVGCAFETPGLLFLVYDVIKKVHVRYLIQNKFKP